MRATTRAVLAALALYTSAAGATNAGGVLLAPSAARA